MADHSDILTHQRTEDFSSFMFDRFAQMRKDGTFTDFKLIVGTEVFRCHRLVVSTHSPVIQKMATTDMAEAAKEAAELKDVTIETMNVLMEYMYTGNISIQSSMLDDLLIIAHYLGIAKLEAWCVSQVRNVLKPENCLAWLMLADQRNYDDMKEQCSSIMIPHFVKVVQDEDFLDLDQKLMQDFMRDAVKSNKVDHDDVLRAIIRWVVDRDAPNRMHSLTNLIVDEALLHKCTPGTVLDIIRRYETFFQTNQPAFKIVMSPELHSDADDQLLVVVGGNVGGYDGRRVLNSRCYTIDGQQLKEICPVPSESLQRSHSVCLTTEGFAFTGGVESTLCLQYNSRTNTWSVLQSLPDIRMWHGSVCISGVIHVMGGNVANQASGSVNYLDVGTGRWQPGTDVPITVLFPRLVQIDDDLYLLDIRYTKAMFKMDVNTKTWTPLEPLPIDGVCKGASMIALNGKLLVAGGVGMICAWYQPDTNAWSIGQPPLSKHHYGSMVQHKGRVLLFGGCYQDGSDDVEEMSLEEEDGGGGWSQVTEWKMPASLCCHYALVLDISR